jgi:hypothetical protein
MPRDGHTSRPRRRAKRSARRRSVAPPLLVLHPKALRPDVPTWAPTTFRGLPRCLIAQKVGVDEYVNLNTRTSRGAQYSVRNKRFSPRAFLMPKRRRLRARRCSPSAQSDVRHVPRARCVSEAGPRRPVKSTLTENLKCKPQIICRPCTTRRSKATPAAGCSII